MNYCQRVLKNLEERYPQEREFLQAAEEVLGLIQPVLDQHPEYEQAGILERLVEPERIIMFRVPVEMDDHHVEVYRGYRVQFNSALGPYKGGLRFNGNVDLSIMKFLGFEQCFKNALTGLPLGGGKGGADFDPRDKSEGEIRRFCEAFMSELCRHIGPHQDVPAGDLGVGEREIGYLYGQYRKLTGRAETGVITGKPVGIGGSLIRREATGYGLVYFLSEMIRAHKLRAERVIISGCGNVGMGALEKCRDMGFKVVGISDSRGYVLDEQLDEGIIRRIKTQRGASLESYPDLAGHGRYHAGSIYDAPWQADVVLPCGTQNEIGRTRAGTFEARGVKIVAEGANMPSDNEAIAVYRQAGIIYGPGKAANAGGVAVSALEMSQNAAHTSWSAEEVDGRLRAIMANIHACCLSACARYGKAPDDYLSGANLAGAERLLAGMYCQGLV